MNLTADIDISEFERVCAEYQRVTGKTAEQVSVRQLKNWCVQAYKVIPLASLAKITRKLPQGVTNVKLVAWALREYVIRRGPYNKAPEGYKTNGKAFDVRVSKRKSRKTGKVTSVTRVTRRFGRYYTRAQAVHFAKKWFNRRKSAITYTRSLMGAILKSLGAAGATKRGISARSYRNEGGGVFAIGAESQYSYRSDLTNAMNPVDGTRAEKIVQAAMRAALPAVVLDIEKETARRLEAQWNAAARADVSGVSATDAERIMAYGNA